ncbi:MAG: DUF2723 domain-containing protein [Ignavibacteria bacterium]|nr:DUF2723 domain-containing protein [Ignavibacteria bacterium]
MRKLDRLPLPALIFCASLFVYLLTLCPTVYVGDSAEFITTALTLGINHPTGYPLYTLLSRFFVVILPFLPPAFAVNLLSAIATALTASCIYHILELLTSRRVVAAVGSLLLAFSQTLWSRATVAEVYTLNSLFITLAILFTLRWSFRGETRYIVLAAFVTGLGLSQHITGALVAFCLLLFVMLSEPRILVDRKRLPLLAGSFLVGLSVYGYLPIRSAADPPLDWGDPETLSRLFDHLLPTGGQGIQRLFAAAQEGRIEWLAGQALAEEFWYFGALAVLGILAAARRWKLLVFLLSVIATNVVFTITRQLPLHADFDAYFLPAYIVMVILIGMAFSSFLAWLERVSNRYRSLPSARLVSILLLLLPAAVLLTNYSRNDKSDHYFGYDFGTNLLRPAEKQAIIFTVGDEQLFLGWYFRFVEKERPDVTVIDTRLLGAPWQNLREVEQELSVPMGKAATSEQRAQEIVRAYMGKRPIYFTHRLPWEFLLRDYDRVHTGMLIELLPQGTDVDYRPTNFTFHEGWGSRFLDERCKLLVDFYPKEYLDNAQFWLNRGNIPAAQNEVNGFFSFPFKKKEDLTSAYLAQSLILGKEERIAEAVAYADSALALNPADWRGYEYRGNFLFIMRDSLRAVDDWRRSLEFNPDNLHVRRNLEELLRVQRMRALVSPPRTRQR